MFWRRIVMALVGSVLLLAATAAGAAAAKPTRPTAAERPLTAVERAESDRRLAAAAAYLAGVEAAGRDLVGLACVTPTGAVGSITPSACSTPQGFLSVEARDQILGHYCGPAAGQVIANYAWAMTPGVNKYSQAKIAGWMQDRRQRADECARARGWARGRHRRRAPSPEWVELGRVAARGQRPRRHRRRPAAHDRALERQQ